MSYQANQPGTELTPEESLILAQIADLGDPGQVLTVNPAGTGVEYTTPASGGGDNLVTVTADYTALEDDSVILVDASSGDVIITIPDSTSGKQYSIKKIDSSVNEVSIISSGTIDGDASEIIKYQNTNILIVTDGTNWSIL